MSEEKTMAELVKLYPDYRNVCEQYYSQLCSKIGSFVEHCQRPDIRPSEITPAMQQAFVNHLTQAGKKPDTVKGYHRAVVAVKNFAKELEIGKVYLPKSSGKLVEGYSTDEIRQLIDYAKTLKGKLSNGVKVKHFWKVAMHSAFSTGLRAGDLFNVAADDVPDDGLVDLVQHKTDKPVRVRFSERAVKLIRKHKQPEAVPWPHSFTWFERCFEKLRNEAGVNRGTWKWFRRSAGSYADENGNGHELLGNTRTVFESNYRVPEIAAKEPPKQAAL